MTDFVAESEWQEHLLRGGPFLDVRAPVEFQAGAVPASTNLPLLTDEERHQVGICYKERGPVAALALGHELVHGSIKAARVAAWKDFVAAHPATLLYCFRGGERSRISQQWLKDEGCSLPRVEGGYKRVRQFLLERLTTLPRSLRFLALTGHTGSGKTVVLRSLLGKTENSLIIDLEALANHRGSAFGNELDPQPSQVDFENRLAVDLMRAARSGDRPIWFEDEARTIGKVALPDSVFGPLRSCPLVVIEEPIESRAEIIFAEYVEGALAQLRRRHDEVTAWRELRRLLTEPVEKISRKLGGARTQEALRLIASAINDSQRLNRWDSHRDWIIFLLRHYYDPYYLAHMERQKARVVFRGSRAEVAELIRQTPPAIWRPRGLGDTDQN